MKHDFPASPGNNLSAQLRFKGYPFERMELGDYFEIPMEEIRLARPNCQRIGQDSGRRFGTRELTDGSFRIMRMI